MRETQTERIVRELRAAGNDGVCSKHWYMTGVPNSRNRLSELNARGWRITSEPCHDHAADEPGYFRYILRSEAPAKPAVQLSLRASA